MSWAAPRRWRIDLRGLVIPVALLVLAQAVSVLAHLQSDSVAPPSEIAVALFTALGDGLILRATYQTLGAAAAGLAIGFVIGLAAGLALGLSRLADRLMEFTVEAFRPIPSVALIPVAMLVYGFGYRMEIAIVAFASLWPVLIMTRAATAGVHARLREVSRLLGFGIVDHVRKIILPAVLPRVFVALRLVIGIALIVAVSVEIAANPLGLGYTMMVAEQSLHPDLMLALLVWIGLIGWTLNALFLQLQQRLFPIARAGSNG
jgi:NitT/TauT family transport system permease protein